MGLSIWRRTRTHLLCLPRYINLSFFFSSIHSFILQNPDFIPVPDTLLRILSMAAEKRPREESPEIDSPEVKTLRYDADLFDDILDESDPDPAINDLDSVIKSLEEELGSDPDPEVQDSGVVSQPELGYLLEASDDELGLPPSTTADGDGRRVEEEGKSEIWDLGENWGFEEETDFETAQFGFVDDCGDGGDLALEGLFDYSDVGFGSTDFSWRSESMSAQ
ncbi:unnamed protein product [Rhodiola kirilowii]